MGARPDFFELVGARIDSIGGVATDALVERFGTYHGGTDGHFRQYFSTPLTLSPAILHAAGVTKSADRARLSLTKTVILDNRFNPGGDLTRTADFGLDLPSLVPDDGAIYVLTSNATFSAGIYTSFFPKSSDPDKTHVIGEHVGDRERFWAESRGPFVLPRSGYRIGRSLQMQDVGVGCPDRDVCHLAGRGRLDIAIGSLEPDIVIATTFADFLAGRDPVLEYAIRAAGG